MNFLRTIEYLKERLNRPLPGEQAHRRAIPRGRSTERLLKRESQATRLGGVMILIYPDDLGRAVFPLIQRPDYPGAHGGQISLPGGKFEEGDDSIIDTALRETYEEIGVSPEIIQVVGSLSEIYIGASDFRVTPVVGFLESTPSFIKDPMEVDEILEVPLSRLMDTRLHKAMDIEIRGFQLPDTPYFDLNERVVWGATAMILSELFHILASEINDS